MQLCSFLEILRSVIVFFLLLAADCKAKYLLRFRLSINNGSSTELTDGDLLGFKTRVALTL